MDPWERQDGETDAAFKAFTIYRDLESYERSVTRAYQVAFKRQRKGVKGRAAKGRKPPARAPGTWCGWSVTYHWVERAAAYDDHRDAIRRQANEQKLREMCEAHADGMNEIFQKGLKRIRTLKDDDIKGYLALNLAVAGMNGERLARGLSTESIEQRVTDNRPHVDSPVAEAIRKNPALQKKAHELLNEIAKARTEGHQNG